MTANFFCSLINLLEASNMKNMDDFYQFYLKEHQNPWNIALHYLGTTASIILIIFFCTQQQFLLILPAFLLGYVFAWVGHFVFEKNKPAALNYPVKSFISDLRLWQSVNCKLIQIMWQWLRTRLQI